MATLPARLPRQLDYWAVGINHFFVDFLNSGRNVVVALIAVSLGLTNTQVGLALLVYNIGNAVSQPFFGLLADRIGPRWLVIGGVSWMIFFSSIAAVAGDWLALTAITIAGLGSGAFHPTGTMVASRAYTTHRNQSTALFFVFGQTGLFLGPIFAGWALDSFDRPGYLLSPTLAFIALYLGWQWVHNTPADVIASGAESALEEPETRFDWAQLRQFLPFLLALSVVIVGYSSISQSATTFIPKLYADLDLRMSAAGFLSGIIMAGGVLGGITGGTLADRFHGKWVVLTSLLFASLFIFLAMSTIGPMQIGLLFVAGFFSGMPHTVLVIAVQNNLPGRAAFASGLVLGIMFFSGSLGSTLLGWVADQTTLIFALQALALFPLVGSLMLIFIPARRIAPVK